MFSFTGLVALSFLSFAAAQSSAAVKGIEANFNQSFIVPQLLSSFNPSALITLNYNSIGNLTPGEALSEELAAFQPTVTVTPANSSVQLEGTYTIVMVDADVVGSNLSNGVNRHWLVNGVTIESSQVSNASATAITSYAGPAPATGSGPHRYVVIFYEQPDNFTAPEAFSQPLGVSLFDLSGYVTESGLGPLVAATYFTVQVGTATASIPVTTAVNSATLTGSSSTSKSGTTATSSHAAATTTGGSNTNAAMALTGISPFIVAMVALVSSVIA